MVQYVLFGDILSDRPFVHPTTIGRSQTCWAYRYPTKRFIDSSSRFQPRVGHLVSSPAAPRTAKTVNIGNTLHFYWIPDSEHVLCL